MSFDPARSAAILHGRRHRGSAVLCVPGIPRGGGGGGEERRRRSAHLRQLSASKRLDWHEEFQGKNVRVLLENPKNGHYGGYTENFLKLMIPIKRENLQNKLVQVRVGEARPEYCLGQIINVET